MYRWLSRSFILLVFVTSSATLSGCDENAKTFFDALAAWTNEGEFDAGEPDSVVWDSEQAGLVLSGTQSTFPVMWVANAGDDTISKIDTVTNTELARYRTFFNSGVHGAWSGPAPSRTAVDGDGNVYVANRHFDSKKAEVIKILAEGGIDRDSSGSIETSQDSTPLGAADDNSNGYFDCSAAACESEDEKVAWAVAVGQPDGLGRSLCIDGDGNIWLGLYSDREYYKISSVDGAVLAGPIDVSPHTPYGCQVDGNGILWGASLGSSVLELDTKTEVVTQHNNNLDSTYGIALANDKVYLGGASRTFTIYDPATGLFSQPATTWVSTLGVASDGDGNIFVGASGGGTVYKFDGAGGLLWSGPAYAGTSDIRGVAADSNGDMWAIHIGSNNVSKYSGADGGQIALLPVGNSPYTYSDATGLGFRANTDAFGTWTTIYDAGSPGTAWGKIGWTADTPAGTSIEVKVRAAESESALQFGTYETVSNAVNFVATGRYIQIRVRLNAGPGGESPVLYALTLAGA